MAENINALILPIGADVSTFEKSIKEVRDGIKTLKAQIEGTSFNLVTPQLKKELKDLENTYATLKTSVQNTGAALNNSVGATKNARTALNSLSLVAQDAPFGFIGIQNNLPGVIQSFGQLTSQSGGLKGALSEIGKSLVGPAGLFLAFSAVTAAVTFAIQKYGSLGAAIDAITGNTNEFTESIRKADKSLTEYNKTAKSTIEVRNDSIGSVENEIIKVNALADVLRSSTTTDRQKQGALAELKKSNDEYFGKLNLQKIDLDLLNESVGKYTESLIKNKVAQNLASEAAGVFTEFLKQNQIAFDIAEKINKAFKDVPTLTKELEDYTKKRDNLIAKGEITAIRFIPISKELAQYFKLNEQLKEVNTNVKSTANSYGLLKTQADSAFKAASGFLDLGKEDKAGGLKTQSFKFEIEPLVDILSLEQKISLLERLGTVILDTKSKESERIQALKELSDLEYDVFGGVELQNLTYNQLKSTLTGLGKTYQSLILQERQRVESLRLVDEAIKRQTYLNQVDREEFVRNYKEKRQEINKTVISIPKQITVPINFPINKENLAKLAQSAQAGIAFGKEEKDIKDREEKYLASIKKIGNAVETGLQKPFRDFFDTLIDEGKFTFDSFADFAKDAFKRILAQLAAAGIARLVTTILTGGIPVPVIGSSRIEQPRFDGVGASPLQLAGAVNLQLRGSDLVGSINRTNTTINRVG